VDHLLAVVSLTGFQLFVRGKSRYLKG